MAAKKPKPFVGRVHLGGGKYQWVGRFESAKERDLAVARRRVELEQARDVESMTVRDYYARWIEKYERDHKHSSTLTIKHRLAGFLDAFGDRQLRDIKRIECEDYAAREGWRVSAIVTMFNAAVRSELLDRNRFDGLAPKSEGRSRLAPPTEEEFEQLLEACSVLGEYAPTMRALVRFLEFTVMRPGEAFELKWSDLDLEANRIQRRPARLSRRRGHPEVRQGEDHRAHPSSEGSTARATPG